MFQSIEETYFLQLLVEIIKKPDRITPIGLFTKQLNGFIVFVVFIELIKIW